MKTRFKMKNSKAIVWGTDLLIAVILFSVGIIVFFIFTINSPLEIKEIFDELKREGNFVSENILSNGFPTDWNSTNVVKMGILSDNKINQTKLERFYNLAQSDYAKTKSVLNTRFDYYFFLDKNITVNGETVEGIGKPGVDKNNVDAKDLVVITRFTIYENKPITATIFMWDE